MPRLDHRWAAPCRSLCAAALGLGLYFCCDAFGAAATFAPPVTTPVIAPRVPIVAATPTPAPANVTVVVTTATVKVVGYPDVSITTPTMTVTGHH
jgi:hypothetical protein